MNTHFQLILHKSCISQLKIVVSKNRNPEPLSHEARQQSNNKHLAYLMTAFGFAQTKSSSSFQETRIGGSMNWTQDLSVTRYPCQPPSWVVLDARPGFFSSNEPSTNERSSIKILISLSFFHIETKWRKAGQIIFPPKPFSLSFPCFYSFGDLDHLSISGAGKIFPNSTAIISKYQLFPIPF